VVGWGVAGLSAALYSAPPLYLVCEHLFEFAVA